MRAAHRRAAARWTAVAPSVCCACGVFLPGLAWASVAVPNQASAATHALGESAALGRVLIALACIIVSARVSAHVFERYLRQPAVLGEMVGGLLLGPTCLGRLSPELLAALVPHSTLGHIGVLANVGAVLFMFMVGMDLDLAALRKSSRAAACVAHAGIMVPFGLGASLAMALFPSYAPDGVGIGAFVLFFGTSLSVTAFPVLVRILESHGLAKTPFGVTAIACAAIDDATAWCLLAIAAAVARSELRGALTTCAATVAFVALMLLTVRPAVSRYVQRLDHTGELSLLSFALLVGGTLIAAAGTELIGIHAVFGAFAFGTCIPHESRLASQLKAWLQPVTVGLLLPIFFAVTGLRTQLALVGSPRDLLVCAVILAAASMGKVGGCYIAARWVGVKRPDALALGVAMNTRGLMELIVLNVGLDLGVLSPTLFAMLVAMALVTTFCTAPLLARSKAAISGALRNAPVLLATAEPLQRRTSDGDGAVIGDGA